MTYPVPSSPFRPEPPAAAPPATYPPPSWPPYGYGTPLPPEPGAQLINAGAGLAIIGGLIIGIGWLVDVAAWLYIVGIGWLMFGPGIGIALLGLGRRR
jgi:hypothetical protein